jgi:hypothetical protein
MDDRRIGGFSLCRSRECVLTVKDRFRGEETCSVCPCWLRINLFCTEEWPDYNSVPVEKGRRKDFPERHALSLIAPTSLTIFAVLYQSRLMLRGLLTFGGRALEPQPHALRTWPSDREDRALEYSNLPSKDPAALEVKGCSVRIFLYCSADLHRVHARHLPGEHPKRRRIVPSISEPDVGEPSIRLEFCEVDIPVMRLEQRFVEWKR